MIDIEREEIIPLKEVADYCATTFKHRPHYGVVYRWVRKGCYGVKLETIRLGSKIFTSKQAVSRFVHDSRIAADERLKSEHRTRAIPNYPGKRTEARRQADIAAARVRLNS